MLTDKDDEILSYMSILQDVLLSTCMTLDLSWSVCVCSYSYSNAYVCGKKRVCVQA